MSSHSLHDCSYELGRKGTKYPWFYALSLHSRVKPTWWMPRMSAVWAVMGQDDCHNSKNYRGHSTGLIGSNQVNSMYDACMCFDMCSSCIFMGFFKWTICLVVCFLKACFIYQSWGIWCHEIWDQSSCTNDLSSYSSFTLIAGKQGWHASLPGILSIHVQGW